MSDKIKNSILWTIIPAMFVYFSMGFVDSVGVASNYMKSDFKLSDTVANLFPSIVFLWFFVCSVPTGIFMNKYGRKNTVLVSLLITLVAVLLPLLGYNLVIMLASFIFLGIGNTIMQVSLNPLMANIVSADKLPSSMTFGQFMKAICSLLAPIIASFAAVHYGNWRLLYIVFLVQGIVATVLLYKQDIQREENIDKTSSKDIFMLLKNPLVLGFFFGIMCHVGIDVGINISAPKIMQEKLGISLDEALKITVTYFLFRTVGSFSGAIIMAKYSVKKFFLFSMSILLASLIAVFFVKTELALYICFAIIGYGNANVFPIVLSSAIKNMPTKNNELSSLMVMGISGGTLFPFIMGLLSDAMNTQLASIYVMLFCVAYLLFLSRKTN